MVVFYPSAACLGSCTFCDRSWLGSVTLPTDGSADLVVALPARHNVSLQGARVPGLSHCRVQDSDLVLVFHPGSSCLPCGPRDCGAVDFILEIPRRAKEFRHPDH